jgi:acid phosphatase (class A)
MSLIDDIQKALAEKLNDIDSLKYRTDLEYHQTPYANMTFPELGGIDLFSIVPMSAKNSSPETRKELEYVAKVANNRSIEDIKLVYLVDEEPLDLFEVEIKKSKLDFPYHKFQTIYNHVVTALVDHAKFFYNRARPFQLAPYYNLEIDRLITSTHHTPSYPSGHTLYGALAGAILTEKYPEKRATFEQLVQKVGHARVLQGVHYPSDNDASIKIMNKIYPKLSEYYEQL